MTSDDIEALVAFFVLVAVVIMPLVVAYRLIEDL